MIYAKISPTQIFGIVAACEKEWILSKVSGRANGLSIRFVGKSQSEEKFYPGYAFEDVEAVLTGQKPYLDLTDAEEREAKLSEGKSPIREIIYG